MDRIEPTPFWFAARLADDTANFLRVQPGPAELAEYLKGLMTLVDVLEASMMAVQAAGAAAISDLVVS